MQTSELLATVAVFGMAGFILWLIAEQGRAKIRYRAEVQKELIAKFSSAGELTEFLNSEAGRLLISSPKDAAPGPSREGPPKTAKQYFAEGIAWGVLALAVGSAILLTRGLTLSGAIFTALGIGFLVNASLGYFLFQEMGHVGPSARFKRVQDECFLKA